jgi:hypothetical protein
VHQIWELKLLFIKKSLNIGASLIGYPVFSGKLGDRFRPLCRPETLTTSLVTRVGNFDDNSSCK